MTVVSSIHAQKLKEDSLQRAAQEERDDTLRIDAILTYGNYLLKHKMQDSAGLALVNQGKKLAEEKNYPSGLVLALLMLGNNYSKKSDWAKSIDAYENIFKIAGRIRDETKRKQALRAAYNNLGGIFNKNGDFTSSLENRLSCLQVIESMPHASPNDITLASINTASDYRQLKEYNKAEEYTNKVTPFFKEIKDFLKLEYLYEYYQIMISTNDHARAHRLVDQYDSILQVGDLSDFQKKDYRRLSYQIRGMYEMEHSKNYANAMVYFKKSLQLAEDLEATLETVTARFQYGWALYEAKRYSEAILWLKEAYNLAVENSLKNQAFKAADLLAKAYEKTNAINAAFGFSKIALALKDSIFNEEANAQLNFFDAKYQYEKRENQITALQQDNQEKEFLIRKKNWFMIGSFVLATLLGIIAYTIFRYYRNHQMLLLQEKNIQDEKIISMERQQQVVSLQSMIHGQETERTRIAKDLHDGLGGIFSTVKMHFSALEYENEKLKTDNLFRKSYALIDTASVELRRIAHNMMPEVLMKLGLLNAVKDLTDNISAGKLINVKFETHGMQKRLNSDTEIMLYRIIQELLNNIVKHAMATEVIIQFIKDDARLSIVVEDNGQGFNTQEVDHKIHAGIDTIKSRVNYLNGKLTIDSLKGTGTTVMMDFLINEL